MKVIWMKEKINDFLTGKTPAKPINSAKKNIPAGTRDKREIAANTSSISNLRLLGHVSCSARICSLRPSTSGV